MIKKFITVVMMAIMVTGLVACGNNNGTSTATDANNSTADGTNQETADNSLQDILDKGELVLGLDASFPPMGFRDQNNDIVGYDIDLANEVAARMGVKLKTQPIIWDSKEQELNGKNIDCIWNGFTANAERLENNQCSKTYLLNKQVAVVLADSNYNTLADLAGTTVIIQKGSSAQDAIDANPDFKGSLGKLLIIDDNLTALRDLGVGSDAVVMDLVVANYYAKQNEGKYRILTDEVLSEEEYVIGFRKGDVALCQEVEKQLAEMVKDGTMAKLDEKWFGQSASTITK